MVSLTFSSGGYINGRNSANLENDRVLHCHPHILYETGTAMNARASENYLAISRSSSASKSVENFWAEIYWGRLYLGPNLVSFNRAVVSYEIPKVSFHVETKILVSMSDKGNNKITELRTILQKESQNS